ncbi:PREDICTED: probable L-type lectin-domain containing receptor kinase S.7 [Ipomoea nil]|uniref:probable L-type lectin-domain containing receptor kinase S.7 n=1 Tax=Ipomoea nil TaxID=35883 RepID=UPI000901630B|nr:PREDICTED: probable L-type lectin-domain containing receptor kinase S.7 [Ipomoea nil]
MEMYSRKLFLYCVFLILFNPVRSQKLIFDFPSFNLTNLTLLGDSYVKNGVLGLTRRSRAPSSSSGSALYKNPVCFFDKHANLAASFSTKFTFLIDSVNPWSSGGGFCFFLSPYNHTLGSSGGFLGLVDSTQITKNRFVAVEFDTEQDLHFDDPDENHVGLDIDTIVSVKTASAMLGGINLKSGFLITAWIDYQQSQKKLEVFLSYSTLKPGTPIMAVDIDLSGYLHEFMFVGFSASTERSTELHFIENWSFQTSEVRALRPGIHSHNLDSDSSVVPVRQPFQVSIKILGLLVLGICGAGFMCAVLVVFWWNSVKKMEQENTMGSEVVADHRQFTYKELRSATRRFNSKNILGQGASGIVYKACFRDSDNIAAVKRMKHEGKPEFVAELSTIAKFRHRNLLRLQGWCAEKGELLVVYDYMPNGSLDKALYPEPGEETPLKWPHRYNIAVGLASVLKYLHQECKKQVIPSDLKPSNVMLDSSYNPRLGDFGLSWLMDHDKTPTGTMGYVAPEYVLYGQATEESDVYSYGVVVLELACGRRPVRGKKMERLVDWVWRLHYEGRIIEAADRRLNGEFREDEMRKVLLVGLSCANPDSNERPSMKRVLQTLMNEVEAMAVPRIKPTLTFSNTLLLRTHEIFSDDEKSGFLELNLRSDSIEEDRHAAV